MFFGVMLTVPVRTVARLLRRTIKPASLRMGVIWPALAVAALPGAVIAVLSVLLCHSAGGRVGGAVFGGFVAAVGAIWMLALLTLVSKPRQ